ncbi:hypothetical protein KXX53_007086, partial [Aspergillus fumigatus]
MARRQRKAVDPLSDDSDSSERESTEDGHYDTDLTEPEDEGLQDKDIPFPISTLRAASQAALKGLATRYLGVILFNCGTLVEFMDRDARSLLGIYSDLLSDGLSERNIVRLDKHKIIKSYADSVLDVLNKDQLLMLSLVTWRFDGSLHDLSARRLPPPDLLQHLSTSAIDDVCENIVANY